MAEIEKGNNANINEDQFKGYFSDDVGVEKKELDMKGSIYCGENGIIMEVEGKKVPFPDLP